MKTYSEKMQKNNRLESSSLYFKYYSNAIMRVIFPAALLIAILLCSSCQDVDLEPGDVVTMSKIPNIKNHKSLTLIGPEWKLLGFGNTENNTVRIAKPAERGNSAPFLLRFNEDQTVRGVSSTNSIYGIYELEGNQLHFTQFGPMTNINELFDGPQYIESMREVHSYDIPRKGLVLFYSGNIEYLLFQPVGD